MVKRTPDSNVRSEIEPVIEGLGYSLVEAKSTRRKGTLQVSVVIYQPDGVGIEDCSTVHRTILPRLEMMEEGTEVSLQVASPGVDRTIKDPREFAVFVGKGIRVLVDDADTWTAGVIESADERQVVITTAGQRLSLPIERVRKARLDYSQEVR
jgi:ribosome maturation factor RimP